MSHYNQVSSTIIIETQWFDRISWIFSNPSWFTCSRHSTWGELPLSLMIPSQSWREGQSRRNILKMYYEIHIKSVKISRFSPKYSAIFFISQSSLLSWGSFTNYVNSVGGGGSHQNVHVCSQGGGRGCHKCSCSFLESNFLRLMRFRDKKIKSSV